ncbi:pyridoxal phosphate phosphatase PHOSPHO2 [Ambystoma mexicanum]|uniref:pyridoxal phosphate phosphatase PHOSPHO2 n=1 Tax=Ambystoma mexicanum TaxID=8296 RepID=UPI0037E87464
MKFLLVFDFDHTVVDENSDTWIVKCAPKKKLPSDLISSYEKGKWTEYMGRVFKYLGDQGIRQEEMKRVMTAIPLTTGMSELLKFVGGNKDFFDCIIISDANAIFIDWILEGADVHRVFDKVFTNPAAFNDVGYMTVQNFHAHHCPDCPQNLCKRKVLEEFLGLQGKHDVQYTKIIYVGDGGNDFCPVTLLKQGDVIMPRHAYTLHKRIARMYQDGVSLASSVHVWSTGTDILSHLKLLWKESIMNVTPEVVK